MPKAQWPYLILYVIVTAIIGRDVFAHLGSAIAHDPGDPLLTAAILQWNATHVPLSDAWWQFPIFFPTRDTMAFSEHLLGLSVIASPIYWITRDPIVTHNLVLLLTYPLCAIAMHLLVYRLTGSTAGALIAGLAFAFGPYRVSQLAHIQMLAMFWAPLALLGLHAYLDTGRRRWLVLYGATWMLQGAANGYALVYFSMLVGFWTLWFVVMRGRWRDLMMIALATTAAVVPLVPILYKYVTVHAYQGFARGPEEIRFFSADIAALLCAPPTLTFWGWLQVKCGPEGELFPGVALTLLLFVGIAWMLARSWDVGETAGARLMARARWLLLLVSCVYIGVIVVVLTSGPFMFWVGPLRVSAGAVQKPVFVAVSSLLLALALSSGVRDTVRNSSTLGFYMVAAIAAWVLSLGPTLTFMGQPGRSGPFLWLMALPGMDGLRVPARFWMIAVLCLAVVAGIVFTELVRGRSLRVIIAGALIAASGVLADGWNGPIPIASLPPPVPGAATLRNATVFLVPPDSAYRDIGSVFHAVNGGWKSVNGYSGYGPSYYHALMGAARAEVDGLLTPFQQFGELHVLVEQNAPRIRALVERQPGASIVASDTSFTHFRLPQRAVRRPPHPKGERLPIRELRSSCSTAILPLAIDNDEKSMWQCGLWDDRQTLTADLGSVGSVGAIVHSLGQQYWLFPVTMAIETSQDGLSWTPAWSGTVLEQTIVAAMEDPKRLRLVFAFSPRPARFVSLRATSVNPESPWTIAELEVWSAATESR
jgi:hypothetical protein